jgi:hypothetical protein
MQIIQSVNSLSIWILILVQYIFVHDKIHIKMKCKYRHSFKKNKSGTHIPGGKGCFYICAVLSHCDVSSTITKRAMFVGILKVA